MLKITVGHLLIFGHYMVYRCYAWNVRLTQRVSWHTQRQLQLQSSIQLLLAKILPNSSSAKSVCIMHHGYCY